MYDIKRLAKRRRRDANNTEAMKAVGPLIRRRSLRELPTFCTST